MTGVYALGSISLAALIALGWSWYRRSCRAVFECLSRVSAKRGGTVKPATLLAYPQLMFQRGGREVFVTAMPSGSSSGGSARSAETFAQTYYDQPSALTFELHPESGTNFIKDLLSKPSIETGNRTFDALFSLRSNDQTLALAVFDRDAQEQLMTLAVSHKARVAFSTVTLFQGGRLVLGQERPRLTVALDGIVTDEEAVDQALALLLTLDDRLTRVL